MIPARVRGEYGSRLKYVLLLPAVVWVVRMSLRWLHRQRLVLLRNEGASALLLWPSQAHLHVLRIYR